MSKITLTRINYAPTYTLGFIKHGDFFCFTLEPKNHIPIGLYPLVWEYSPKFKRNLWELKNVPNRSEIKIHSGNDARDTEGCILVGESVNREWDNYLLFRSVKALLLLNNLCHDQKITEIEIRDV